MTIPILNGPPTPVADLLDTPPIRRTADGGVELFGSRCPNCDSEAFPARQHCRVCFSDGQLEIGLGNQGVLYSYTVVRISSSRETPYAIGYVDLPGGLRVLADLEAGADSDLGCDVAVELRAAADDAWHFAIAATNSVGTTSAASSTSSASTTSSEGSPA